MVEKTRASYLANVKQAKSQVIELAENKKIGKKSKITISYEN